MKKYLFFFLFLCTCCLISDTLIAQGTALKLVFIRHAERPEAGDNLTCQGLNRSMQLPAVLYKKFGKPVNIYVPALKTGEATKRGRMFQTITPFAAKFNININSVYDEEDYKHVGKALLKETGTVVIVWEHKNIVPILTYLGVKTGTLKWVGADFDSIWIVTFPKGSAILTKDKEGLKPLPNCPF